MSNRKKEIFKEIIANFVAKPKVEVISRDLELPLDLPKIISVIGPRRSGKTWLLYEVINKLRPKIEAERLIYINFEDDRLFPIGLEDMDALVKAYYELYPQNKDKKVWFFLDEIQEVAHWEKFVRRLYDTEKCRIYLTGSTSSLLSREMSTSLRGRTVPYEVFPLSFKEYLQFKGKKADKKTTKGQAEIRHNLEQYFSDGGFPELCFLPEVVHRRVINEYIDLMLYRDLAERFSLDNPHLLKYLLKNAMVNVGNLMNISKLYNDMKSQGYTVSRNTIYDYIQCLEEAFAIFRVQVYSRSVKRQTVNPVKVYAVDLAFKHAMSISKDLGRQFENVVFMELRRRGKAIHYFKEKSEVDFVVDDQQLINACLVMNDWSTRDREVKGMNEAMGFLGMKEGTILTWDMKEEIEVEAGKVIVRPLWEWMLE